MEKTKVDATYCEAFYGLFVRVLVTAERGIYPEDRLDPYLEKDELRFAAYRSTSTPATVVGRTEAGIEGWLPKTKTPDGREGVILQFWSIYDEKKLLLSQIDKLYREFSIPVRQDILSCYTTSLFDWLKPSEGIEIVGSIDTQRYIGDCGGGFERLGKEVIEVPLMGGQDFVVDKKLNVGKGVSGANLWFFCDTVLSGRKAGREAIKAISEIEGVITSFYICPSGSMVANYKEIGPPTNYQYCPSLKNEIENSLVPEGIRAIPEIVIDGISLEAVKKAMKAGIESVYEMDVVKRISAGNYGGKLGQVKLELNEIVPHLFE
ncbi:MAG: formylmethanofuran--tetrahydromethanopterin formyltransferase [Promethearchaeota archaeon]